MLADGVARERLGGAVSAYADGRMTVSYAAGQVDVSLYEMIDRVADAGIPYRIDHDAIESLRGSGAPMDGTSRS